jgi:ATP-grasp domain
VTYGAWLARPPGVVPDLAGIDRAAAEAALTGMRQPADPDRALTDAELQLLLGCYGIEMVDFSSVGSVAEAVTVAARIGYPVALKSFDQSLRHQMDQSGVRLGLANSEQLKAAYDDLASVAGPWLYVQAMAARDRAVVSTEFRISADPSFGALISFGIGGVATELLDDRAYRAVPLTDADAADLIGAPRAAPLLDGYRGARIVAREPLIELALRLSLLADDLPEVSQLLLLPVLAGPGGIAVTSGTGRIGPRPMQPDARRRLR